MNIMYCGDKNIESGLIISILSLIKNNTNELNFYVLTMKYDGHEMVSKKCINLLEKKIKKVNKASSIKLIDVTKEFEKDKPEANLDTRFTPFCMLRLYSDLVNLPNKILYLDNDVVCLKNIEELYNIDVEKHEIAGVLDYYGKHIYKKHILKRDYINSGVLLMNMKLIKETGLLKKCRKMCKEKEMLLPDQAALNKLANTKLIINNKFNEQHKTKKDTVFRHFSNTFIFFPRFKVRKIKPWDIEKLHVILKEHSFDDVLDEYKKVKDDLNG